MEHANQSVSTLDRQRESFVEKTKRLKIVLETKEKIASGDYDDLMTMENLEDADLYSDTTSLAGTVSSQISAKKSNPASLKTR